jgi:hypothetical protein
MRYNMSDVNTETLKELLKGNVVEVKFTKVSGEERVMKCTLQESHLPVSTGESTRKKNDEVLSVWDIDNSGWRSFRLDSIVSYNLEVDNGSKEN